MQFQPICHSKCCNAILYARLSNGRDEHDLTHPTHTQTARQWAAAKQIYEYPSSHSLFLAVEQDFISQKRLQQMSKH